MNATLITALSIVYIIIGASMTRYVSKDIIETGKGTSPSEDVILVLLMLLWPLAVLYGILAILAGGKSEKKAKK